MIFVFYISTAKMFEVKEKSTPSVFQDIMNEINTLHFSALDLVYRFISCKVRLVFHGLYRTRGHWEGNKETSPSQPKENQKRI